MPPKAKAKAAPKAAPLPAAAQPERAASPAQLDAWRQDQLQNHSPCLPRGFGLRWLGWHWERIWAVQPGAAQPRPAQPAFDPDRLAITVAHWTTIAGVGLDRVRLSTRGLECFATPETATARNWLESLRENAPAATGDGFTTTPFNNVRASASGRRVCPPPARLR